jgi:hypothetical protein
VEVDLPGSELGEGMSGFGGGHWKRLGGVACGFGSNKYEYVGEGREG